MVHWLLFQKGPDFHSPGGWGRLFSVLFARNLSLCVGISLIQSELNIYSGHGKYSDLLMNTDVAP